MAERFRGFLPVVVDVETGGFNAQTDALLEVAAVFVDFDDKGILQRRETYRYHVKPFDGANMDPASLAVNGIDPDHPLRPAIDERDALGRGFPEVRRAVAGHLRDLGAGPIEDDHVVLCSGAGSGSGAVSGSGAGSGSASWSMSRPHRARHICFLLEPATSTATGLAM